MKKASSVFCLCLIRLCALSQVASADSSTVNVTLYNNSMLLQRFSLVSYSPGETRNGTVQLMLKPYGKTVQEYKRGTRLYLADKKQVDIVMRGDELKSVPFKIIAADDNNKIIKLNK